MMANYRSMQQLTGRKGTDLGTKALNLGPSKVTENVVAPLNTAVGRHRRWFMMHAAHCVPQNRNEFYCALRLRAEA